MADYKEMYFKLFRATENAIDILISAQQECEEMYIRTSDPELKVSAENGEPTAQSELE